MRERAPRTLNGVTAVVLSVLTIVVALLPFFTTSLSALVAARQLMAVALVVAIWLDSERRTIPVLVTVIAILHGAFQWETPGGPRTVVLEQVLALAFILASAGYLIRRLWTIEQVSAANLLGATAVYFLLGLFWDLVFSVMEMRAPGSFAHACPPGPDDSLCRPELGRFPRLAYLSFVTLTTLGYGDVVPLTSRAEGVAIMAAVSGQLFMAVLVGRLVGSYLAASRSSDSTPPDHPPR